MGVCDQGFKPEYAKLACKELGYPSGTILPQGAYGKYYKHLARPYIRCNGSEASLLDCDFDKQVSCTSTLYHYVGLCCHEDKPEAGLKHCLFSEYLISYMQDNLKNLNICIQRFFFRITVYVY